jgi:hypothetical protein
MNHFRPIVGKKNDVCYGDRVIRPGECHRVILNTERFFAWVFGNFRGLPQ